MSSSPRFWDKIAKRYAASPIADEAAYQRKLEMTRDYFRPDMELLELGCGTGSTAILHAPYVRHILATDLSSAMLAIAQDRIDEAGVDNITLQQVSVDELEVPQPVDMVLALSLLHLLDNRDQAIEKIFAMLKPGGLFVSSTVCLADFMKWIRWIVPLGRLIGKMPFVSVFSESDLTQAITRPGFEIDQRWRPGPKQALFLVARKPLSGA